MAIVLIPSIALLTTGIGGATYLVRDGQKVNEWAALADATSRPLAQMVQALQEERRISLLHLAGDGTAVAQLAGVRNQADVALAAVREGAIAARELRPDTNDELDDHRKLFDNLTQLRGGIDARMFRTSAAFSAFNKVIDAIALVVLLTSEIAPHAKVAVELYKSTHLLRAAEALSRVTSLGSVALLTGQLPAAQIPELARYIGDARGEVAYLSSVLTGARQEQLKQIVTSTEWQRNIAMENALLQRAPAPTKLEAAGSAETRLLPMDVAEWQQVAGEVCSRLLKIWVDQMSDAQSDAQTLGDRLAQRSFLGGSAVLAVTLVAVLGALLLANRFVGRMKRLRRDTLELADERLPEAIRQLSTGKQLGAVDELAKLDYGTDEIGQVADAFNRAHRAAVSAAVTESKTRAGVNAVFLNIAHRSQVIVHRQLELLDQAEREEENPERLDLLFQLDHLATRSRRNAENLTILGGDQPGRRWRYPVPLIDVVRGAVAESLDYTRIHIGQAPHIQITGHAVADMIHLFAELADNATTYSPPTAKVEITGNVVGKGVAVEISDQGLGMSVEEIGKRNALLANPPDFSVASLSSASRLGLFVVAKLAAGHGISVRLAESDYGGMKAIVLIPLRLSASELEAGPSASRPARANGE